MKAGGGEEQTTIQEVSEQEEEDEYFVLNSDFVAQSPNQITCLQDDKVKLIKKVNDSWWLIQTTLGAKGQVPAKQLDFYFESEKQPGPSTEGFKRTASKIFHRTNSIKGLKVSTAAIKSSTSKLKGQFTPKRKTSKLGTDSQPNIPTDEDKSRGWGFVKNKFLTDSRKKGTPGKSDQTSNKTVEKTDDRPVVLDVKVVNSTPNKPPRRNKRASADSHATQGSLATVPSPAISGRSAQPPTRSKLVSKKGANENAEPPETASLPVTTPRSGDLSMNESCVWDSFVEMKTYEEVPLIQDSLQNLNSQSTPNVISPESQSDLERQSSTDTSNFESGSEETLPDPPAPGTFSPARGGTATSTALSHASSTYHSSGLMSLVLPPANAGSTLTVVQVTPRCSTEDLLSLPTTESELQSVLNSSELQEILSPTRQQISTSSPRKTAARSLKYEDEEVVDLSGAPDPPTSQITPTKRLKPCTRAASNMSNMSILSDMSSAPSEAPSFSGTKSGIHYFSPPPEAEGTEGDDVLDTPRIKRIIKSDPVYTQIVDDSFFDNPLEVSELDDVISMRSEDMEEGIQDKTNGQNVDKNPNNEGNGPPISQGSDPKWDEYARKVREKKKREDEERLRKEEERGKKKVGRGWFTKSKKEKSDNSFVKKKELEELPHDITMSSTNTLTNTSCNTLTDTPTSLKSENTTSNTTSNTTPSANKPYRPPLPRKKRLQRQRTLNEDSRPSLPENTQSDSVPTAGSSDYVTAPTSLSVPTTRSSDYVTASTSLSETGSGTQSYVSDTLKDVLSLPVVDEHSENKGPTKIEFRRSSIDLSRPTDLQDFPSRGPRRSASESEIFELISPDYPRLDKEGDPLSGVVTEKEEEEEDHVVIRRVRSDLGTPGSSDTHVTQDTPTNEDDETVPEKTETERMETEDISEEVSAEMPGCRPLSLSICTPDDALDMSANNTLSFVFTQPPRLFTVNVTGEQSQVKVCRSPKLTPEKKQGTSQDPDDEVFEANEDGAVKQNHGDEVNHHGDEADHHGEEDEEVVLQIERDRRVNVNATPPSGGKKRKSRSESGEGRGEGGTTGRLPAPQVTPLKLYSPPKAAKFSQNDVSPTSRLTDLQDRDSADYVEPGGEHVSPVIESHYEELNITTGTPVVDKVTVIVATDDEEHGSEAAMSEGKKNKIRKQYSVHCDGRENLRVASSPPRRKRGTSEDPGDVEVDSAMTNSEYYSYPRAPGDNILHPHHHGDKVLSPGDNHLNSVKVPYKKAYSHPPHQDRNIMKLDLNEPPHSAQPLGAAPALTPQTNSSSVYVYQEQAMFAEPNHPGPWVMPPPLPADYLKQRFGEDQTQAPPPPRRPAPPATGYHQTEAGYHQTSSVNQSQIYPILSSELINVDQEKPQKLSGTSDSDEIVQLEPAAAATQRCGVQTRNVKVNTDTYHYASYSTDPKSKSWLMKIKKTFGMERSASKKKMKVNVEKDKVPPPRPAATPAATHHTSPSVVRTRAEVTAHMMTSQPHTVTSQSHAVTSRSHAVTSQVSHASSQPAPCTPTAPQPTPEPTGVSEYEPDNKPGKQPELYPPLPTSQPSPPPPLTPSQINTQIFGTGPAVPFPNAGIVPNVPFMWFPFGVPQPQAPGYNVPQLPQAPLPPSVPQLPHSESQTSNRISKRKKVPEKEHTCVDPTLLSQDLIRHVKRSCGLNSSRSRTAARAIIQCLEDSVSDTLKIQLLSELLTAMDTSYRSRRSQEQESGRRKRTRAIVEEDNSEVPRNHSCKKALREERVLMKYLQQVLEILEEMSDHPDKENETFHMYFNLANRLLDTMYHKIAPKTAPFDAS
ncbi:hypothetical protein ACHWQZ_G003577 [Mnemiopsis leidyi]